MEGGKGLGQSSSLTCPFTDEDDGAWRGEGTGPKPHSSSVAESEQKSEAPVSLFLPFPWQHAVSQRHLLLQTGGYRLVFGMLTDFILSESLFPSPSSRSVNKKSIPSSYPLFLIFPLWFVAPPGLTSLGPLLAPTGSCPRLLLEWEAFPSPRPHSTFIPMVWEGPQSHISDGAKNPSSHPSSHGSRF